MAQPSTPVAVHTGELVLSGDLTVPRDAGGLILFAHGSGSSRLSPRNRFVADALVDAGFATLLFDLLSVEEEHDERDTRRHRFDVSLLSSRLVGATQWTRTVPSLRELPVGYFGASTGAAAALVAAAELGGMVSAVVSRGGRPDLAGMWLLRVLAPTLLIVGGDDLEVLALNRIAYGRLSSLKQLEVVANAGHLFEEAGALAQVTKLAIDWFGRHLGGKRAGASSSRAVLGPRP